MSNSKPRSAPTKNGTPLKLQIIKRREKNKSPHKITTQSHADFGAYSHLKLSSLLYQNSKDDSTDKSD